MAVAAAVLANLTPARRAAGQAVAPVTPDAVAAAPASPPILAPAGLPGTALLPARGVGAANLVAPPRAQAGGGLATGPNWRVTPSVGLTAQFDDGVPTASGGTDADLVTILQPGLALDGETRALRVNLAYTPQVYLYARNGDQNRVAQDFNARALATLLPETLFLDVRGFGAEVSQFGGRPPGDAATLSRDDAQQAVSVSVAPYLQHRFGGLGTGELGYALQRTVQSAGGGNTNLNPFPPAALASQRVTTQNLHAAFTTGEDFGRYNGAALASATRFDGTGVLQGAHRRVVSLDSGYAVTRQVTALARIGYEDIHYSGGTPLTVQDVLWDAGVRLTPGSRTSLTLRYGHHDGFESLTMDATAAPTPRIRLGVQYSAGLTTGAEQLQNALASTDLDALGNPVDHATGAPVLDASNFFGLQPDLYRLRRLSATASWLGERDTLTAELDRQSYTVLSTTPGAASLGSNEGTYGSLSWSRDLAPLWRGGAYVQYGARTIDGPPATTQHLFVASLSLSRQLAPGLAARAQWTLDHTTGAATTAGVGAGTRNLVLVGITKTF